MRDKKINITEEDMILQCQQGDMVSFDALVLKYKDMIFNLCYRITGDYDEANDCAQDAFIKAYTNIKSFAFKSSFSTWLFRIAVNTCKNRVIYLSRIKRKTVSLDNDAIFAAIDNMQSAKENNPSKIYEHREREAIIQSAIMSLPKSRRILVVLRDIENKSYEEICGITGLKLGTVKSQLARAREKMRDKLEGVL